jgi:hypothetical protein
MRIATAMSTARRTKGGKTDPKGDGNPSEANPPRRSNDPGNRIPGSWIETTGQDNRGISEHAATINRMVGRVVLTVAVVVDAVAVGAAVGVAASPHSYRVW